MAKRKYNWESVDWSKPTGKIAKELGVTPSQVSIARRRYAPETMRKYRLSN